MASKVAELL